MYNVLFRFELYLRCVCSGCVGARYVLCLVFADTCVVCDVWHVLTAECCVCVLSTVFTACVSCAIYDVCSVWVAVGSVCLVMCSYCVCRVL